MREWYESLVPRERLMVALGGAAAAIIVLWGFVWLPLSNGTSELRDSLDEKRALLVDLQRVAGLPSDASIASAGGDRRSLVVLVVETGETLGLSFSRTRPDGPDAIRVSFDNAPFDTLIEWLVRLERTEGVRVEQATFNGTRTRGLVNGQLSLRRP